ncbi:MAG: serine--tRNA ligase [Lachnospiraceae bacterium]|nr:serine--tRNA ligase [Lachnospiraceae bacterium]MBQ4242538.1 serine--tRNA ligase [Lachnospiraceae bacterium]
MLDIRFVRENPDAVKENIKKKFQDEKLPLVDEAIELDAKKRSLQQEADDLKAERNKISKQIGALMGQGKKEEAEEVKKQVADHGEKIAKLDKEQSEAAARLQEIMYVIPQMIDETVPIGKDDSENVEIQKYGDPVVPDYEIPYHTDIMESLNGIDLDAARRVAGNGFYYLLGDIARLHSAVITYARDFMIDRGFTYVIPPFMIHGNVVQGVMSFPEMEAMMYKIEGEDLYLIGTSEHSMIGRFIDQQIPEEKLPLTLTSYSPCFRKEKGAHGVEERGVYRIHQFEKQEMIVVCKPEDSKMWYDRLWQNTVDLFRSMEIPVRTLECCSGDLADLKCKSCDVEAWSPRQKKYFEVGSCSNLGDAQARRLRIRIKGEEGNYLAHTLNNTVVAPPRMLIAFLENHLQKDGSVTIPEVLRPYMGGKDRLVP